MGEPLFPLGGGKLVIRQRGKAKLLRCGQLGKGVERVIGGYRAGMVGREFSVLAVVVHVA